MPIRDVATWAEGYRQYWTDSFDRLDTYLQDLQQPTKEPARAKRK